MTPDLLLALAAFAFVTSVTPGPNNLMLLASGANYGLRRTVPHMLGISLGHAAMVALVGLGIAAAFEAVPGLRLVFAAVSVAYLLWLAWRIATASAPGEGTGRGRPMTFLEAAAFQWVNPKAWTMALGAVTLYAGGGGAASVLVVAGVFAAVNLPSVSLWAAMGVQVRRLLGSPRRLRIFNWSMAAMLVASLWPSVAPLL